jgi:Male sterility protein
LLLVPISLVLGYSWFAQRIVSKNYSDEEIINFVFLAIEKLNAELEAYAHISHDMIHVLLANVIFRKTDKGTVIRSAFYQDFQKQIDQIYDNEEATEEQALKGDELINLLHKELLELVPSIEPDTLSSATDVFSLGVDSLQSIRLRTTIFKTLDLGGRKPSQNFVFENPLLQAMAEDLTRLRLGKGPMEDLSAEERMQKLIEKYTQDFKVFVSIQRTESGEHIVISSPTGSLGAHIISKLAKLDQVTTIYCLVRASSVDLARRRVQDSLRARGVLDDISPSAKRKIVALPADISNTTRLGLEENVYQQITKDVTAVIHCAWSVNFNWFTGKL